VLITDEQDQVFHAAYQKAWSWLSGDASLTPDERLYAPGRLREYIRTLINGGETDAETAARQAFGLVRQFEQILQSQGHIQSPSIHPR
jgi:hypothetical protein